MFFGPGDSLLSLWHTIYFLYLSLSLSLTHKHSPENHNSAALHIETDTCNQRLLLTLTCPLSDIDPRRSHTDIDSE